ncbi:hypothetical protein FB451DRAFT_68808 [Mycena latifolia]|nr:hypothetical protein FB451DRAFT_68808 [Mycena latifolia]
MYRVAASIDAPLMFSEVATLPAHTATKSLPRRRFSAGVVRVHASSTPTVLLAQGPQKQRRRRDAAVEPQAAPLPIAGDHIRRGVTVRGVPRRRAWSPCHGGAYHITIHATSGDSIAPLHPAHPSSPPSAVNPCRLVTPGAGPPHTGSCGHSILVMYVRQSCPHHTSGHASTCRMSVTRPPPQRMQYPAMRYTAHPYPLSLSAPCTRRPFDYTLSVQRSPPRAPRGRFAGEDYASSRRLPARARAFKTTDVQPASPS